MNKNKKLGGNFTVTFRLLKKLKLIGDAERYGHITPWGLVRLTCSTAWRRLIFNYAYKAYLLEPINKKVVRPFIWKRLGCKMGSNVHIGHAVRLDFGNAGRITVGDDVVISNGVTLLCHKRDVQGYRQGQKATRLPFKYENVTLKKGCQIGLNTTSLPGVTIGEGCIVGSCSVVTKTIPDWTIAVGNPARVVKTLDPP